MNRKLICLLLTLTVFTGSSFVFATKEQEKLNETNEKRQVLQTKINENKKETNAVAEEITQLSNQIDKTNGELSTIQNELSNLNEKMVVTKQELREAEKNITERSETFDTRLRVMYKNGTIGYLEVLLGSEDIIDFFSRMDMIKRLINYDLDLLEYMKEQRSIIESKKKELEIEQINVASAKRQIETKKNELVVATRAKEGLMDKLQKDGAELEKQYDELNAQADALTAIIAQKQREAAEISGNEVVVTNQQASSSGMVWPAPGYNTITSPFGYRVHPIFGVKKMHTGVDIPTPMGASIVAVDDGVVQHSGGLGGYGNTVIIDHGGQIATLYAHNSSLLVKAGQRVGKGQIIAKAGSTGYSTGPHLHFEVRKNGSYINPEPWIR